MGYVAAAGAAYLAAMCTSGRREVWAVTGCAGTFLVFLIAAPASLAPLKLVELQVRYFNVVLLLVSVGAGGAFSEVFRRLSRASRGAAAAGITVSILSSLIICNDLESARVPRYNTLHMAGIERAIETARRIGVTEVVLPTRYYQLLPDRYYGHGVRVTFLDARDATDTDRLFDYLAKGRGRALIVLREELRSELQPRLRSGEYSAALERAGQYSLLCHRLRATGFRERMVKVPNSAQAFWWYRLGATSGEHQLVAWTYSQQ
jgi:hypothetical protein